jgi:glycosyltransferase involved in cell wall biosynthesis
MKILIVSDNFPPERNAPANRIGAHSREWSQQGADITVITSAPNFPSGKVFAGYHNWPFRREKIGKVKVHRVWTFIWPNRGIVFRLLDFLSFAFTACLAGLLVSCDAVLTTSPQFFVNFSGFFLSRIKRRPWILEIRDLWPESVGSVGIIKTPALLKPFEWFELFFYRRATLIVVVTEGIRANLIRRGIEKKKIVVAPNGADHEIFDGVKKSKKAEKISILFAGTFGSAHKLDFLLATVKHLERTEPELANRFQWTLIGEGAERDHLLTLASDLNLLTLKILPAIDRSLLAALFQETQWSFIHLKNSETFRSALPSKIFESAAMGTPMLLGVAGEAQELVEKFKAGIYFEAENRDSLIATLKKIQKLPATSYREMAAGCDALAKEFSREKIAKRLYGEIEKRVSTR